MAAGFDALPLRAELLEALRMMGFSEMTPIQESALPPALAGRDVTGRAMTGSGKTLAFGLALLERIEPEKPRTQALVLCPTRELSAQVASELRTLARRLPNARVQTLTGGRPIRGQIASLEREPSIVVGTPGRLADHLRRGTLRLDGLRVLVLDEADRLLDMGFAEEVRAICAEAPPQRQTLLFSATFPEAIRSLSRDLQRDPVFVELEARLEPSQLAQEVIRCEPDERLPVVADILAAIRPSAALVFCHTRNDCDDMAAFLAARGASVLALHGQMDQRDRDDAILQLENGSLRVLVATDVAARGIDITGLPLVIVSELSPDPDGHVHRVGRTGRAGDAGRAICLVAGPAEEARLRRIESHLRERLEPIPRPEPSTSLDNLTAPHRTLLILAGRRDKLRKGDILGALVQDGGLSPESIGPIHLDHHTCAVAIAVEAFPRAYAFLERGRVKNRRLRVRIVSAGPPRCETGDGVGSW